MHKVFVGYKAPSWRGFQEEGERPIDELWDFLGHELGPIVAGVLGEPPETVVIVEAEWEDGETQNVADLDINIQYGVYAAMAPHRRSKWAQAISDLVIAGLAEDKRMRFMPYYTLDVQVQYAPCSGVSRSVRDGVGVTSATW